MTPREIRANLVLKGIKQREIAEKADVTPGFVSMVISGYRNGEKALEVKKIIAEELGMDVDEVFDSAA
ncbi:MAG: Winged helix-turn-helix DNA-binding [Halanaerobiales bacterium]|nr:Winged helix-turn-helix DNA-binding [Halanaerobiales bacterium]